MDDAEPFLEPPGPLEIVEQGPQEVAANVGSLGDRVLDGLEVVEDVGGALGVMNPTVLADHVPAIGPAVLGDVERRQVGIFVPQSHQQSPKPVRVHLPVHRGPRQVARGERHVLRAHERRRLRPGSRFKVHTRSGAQWMPAHVVVVVVVHAQEVDRRANRPEVSVLDQLFEPVLAHVY